MNDSNPRVNSTSQLCVQWIVTAVEGEAVGPIQVSGDKGVCHRQ